jgi:hypothetical protein
MKKHILTAPLGYFACTALVQLTVFDVSSSDITEKGRISAQQQFEIDDQIESSRALTFGLDRKWEMRKELKNMEYSIKNGLIYRLHAATALGIWYKKLQILASWFSISHQIGELSAGFEIFLTERLPLPRLATQHQRWILGSHNSGHLSSKIFPSNRTK